MTHTAVREFARITGDTFTAQCASCGISRVSDQMYFDSDKHSPKYKAHYCSPCACMLVIASSDAADRLSASVTPRSVSPTA